MATRHVEDWQVCLAYSIYADDHSEWPTQILRRMTGQPEKVCYRATERAASRNLVEYGTSLRSGWLTEAGRDMLANVPPGYQDLMEPVDVSR